MYTIEGSRSSSVVVYSTIEPEADAVAVSVLWDRLGEDTDEDFETALLPGAVEPTAVGDVVGIVVGPPGAAEDALEVAGGGFDVVGTTDCPGVGEAGGAVAAV